MRALALLLGLVTAAAGSGPPEAVSMRPTCLDTVAMRRLYRLGELEEVYWRWRSYFKMAADHQMILSRDCVVEGSRMVGALGLILENDTVLATHRFTLVTKLSPRKEMWDLSLPMAAQAFWDHYVAERRNRTEEEIWQDKWLPPISLDPPHNAHAAALRSTYHSARLLYAQAMDPIKYDMVVQRIAGLEDPAFSLLRADVSLRMGEGPTRALHELDHFYSPSSLVISEFDAVLWRTRLGDRIRQQQEPIQVKRDSAIVQKPPTLRVRPRGER